MLALDGGCYHVISRTTGQQFLMGPEEKDRLMGLLYRVAEFSGAEVLTFALMDNHFHLLVKIPKYPEVDESELVRRMRVLYGDEKTDRVLHDWEVWERKGMAGKVQAAKAALRARMYDLSQFCKTLKETYSMSFNIRNAHSGTIWGSRFKSILLSPDCETLMSVGAYIDLNPVRAEVVPDAGVYSWSGFSQAQRGLKAARQGLMTLVSMAYARTDVSYEKAVHAYRSALEGFIESPALSKSDARQEEASEAPAPNPPVPAAGEAPVANDAERPVASLVRRPQRFQPRIVAEVLETGGKITLFAMLRCRVRHFSHGVALGSIEFVRMIARGLNPRKDTWTGFDCCDEIRICNARPLRGDDKVSVPKGRRAL
jgi:REP element-mobilizing transposase RayT